MEVKCSAGAEAEEDLLNLFVHLSQYLYFAHSLNLRLRMNPANYREKQEKQEKSKKMVIPVFDKSKALMIHLRELGYSNLLNCQHFQ